MDSIEGNRTVRRVARSRTGGMIPVIKQRRRWVDNVVSDLHTGGG